MGEMFAEFPVIRFDVMMFSDEYEELLRAMPELASCNYVEIEGRRVDGAKQVLSVSSLDEVGQKLPLIVAQLADPQHQHIRVVRHSGDCHACKKSGVLCQHIGRTLPAVNQVWTVNISKVPKLSGLQELALRISQECKDMPFGQSKDFAVELAGDQQQAQSALETDLGNSLDFLQKDLRATVSGNTVTVTRIAPAPGSVEETAVTQVARFLNIRPEQVHDDTVLNQSTLDFGDLCDILAARLKCTTIMEEGMAVGHLISQIKRIKSGTV